MVEPTVCLDAAHVLDILCESMSTMDEGCARVKLHTKDEATYSEIEANDNWAEAFVDQPTRTFGTYLRITHDAICTAAVTT